MYIPKINKVENQAEIIRFIDRYNFAAVTSYDQDKPVMTHIPMEYELRGEDLYLKGHLAKANPQWKTFQTDQTILISFMEAHTYVSSSWYEKVDVPTWNYIAVHMYGKPRIFEEEELLAFVSFQMEKYEQNSTKPVKMEDLDPQVMKRNLRGIIGFEIRVEDIQARYKLSQNKSAQTFKNVVEALERRTDEQSHKIAQAMRDIRSL